jgi:methyltransferase (TIGR00027 family)
MPGRRIESGASRTADMTCGCRAISYMESNPLYKSDDWVAPRLLPRLMQFLVRIPITRRLLSRVLGPQGIYEWVIARTKYIDDIFRQASARGFSQVLLFGAGFDSRAVRFQSELKHSQVFELDAPTTQTVKIGQYRRRGIEVPSNQTFVPIDFEKESVSGKLKEAGFDRGKKTLVILEGVLQYLKPEAVYATLDTIKNHVGLGSWLVFDYAHASMLRAEGNLCEESRMMKGLNKFGESWQFGLDETEVEPMLYKYGFKLLDRKGPKELEEAYFKDEKGVVIARVNGTQSIVKAERQ